MSASPPTSPSAVTIGVAVLDTAGAVVVADPEFERLVRKTGPSLVGTRLFEEFGPVLGPLNVRLLPFDEVGGRCVVVLVEEAGEVDRLRAVEAAYDQALQTASHVRHEINNSLMGILGHVELLLARSDTPEPIRRRAEVLLREVEKMRDVAAALQTIRRG